MINEIKVNTTRLENDAEKVNSYINNIKKAVDEIERRVQRLDNMWEGESSEAFKKAINADIKEIRGIHEYLLQVHKYETNAKKKYETCEGKVAELVAEIKV